MRHIPFVTPPTPGHVFSTLPLVEELVARGHRVLCLWQLSAEPLRHRRSVMHGLVARNMWLSSQVCSARRARAKPLVHKACEIAHSAGIDRVCGG